ncbi:MAG: hypothetical protein HYS24_00400 [Ignavibacteriales bacterium]|nr:hypothetical protein [Ignavibacteriales bacterium]
MKIGANLNELETTYYLINKLLKVRDELTNWSSLIRKDLFSDFHNKQMVNLAFEIDELLRDIGIEWITDFEENMKIKNKIMKDIANQSNQ